MGRTSYIGYTVHRLAQGVGPRPRRKRSKPSAGTTAPEAQGLRADLRAFVAGAIATGNEELLRDIRWEMGRIADAIDLHLLSRSGRA